jgi:hypothetical protein
VAIRHIYPSNDSRYYKWWIENSLWRQEFHANVIIRKVAPEEFDKKVRDMQLRIVDVHVGNTIVQQGINPPAVNEIDTEADQH